MPLVIVTGLPCSGKSQRASQLASYLEASGVPRERIHIVHETAERAGERANAFKDARAEKILRATFLSSIERLLTKEDVVIADGLNYIKGFRYQLHCLARTANTPHVTLWCVVPEATCFERNEARLAGGGGERPPQEDESSSGRALAKDAYPRGLFGELASRYEEPNNQARWDAPLFTVGAEGGSNVEEEWRAIYAILQQPSSRPPSMATAVNVNDPLAASSCALMQALDRQTQSIVEAVMAHLRHSGTPTTIDLSPPQQVAPPSAFVRRPLGGPPAEAAPIQVVVGRPVLIGDLQRLRRQFVHLNRVVHAIDAARIDALFAEYLSLHLQQ